MQSLKNLDDPHAFPMVAVRSAGLSLSSLIGFSDDDTSAGGIRAMVSEEYLHNLLEIANDRFKANQERVARFGKQVLQETTGKDGSKPNSTWETREARRSRLRSLGLEQQSKASAMKNRDNMSGTEQVEEEGLLGAQSLDASQNMFET